MTADLTSLAQRLEGARGPDRELDCLIHAVVVEGRTIIESGRTIYARNSRPPHDQYVVGWTDPGKVQRNFSEAASIPPVPPVTSSIDASLALVERKLPGTWWLLSRGKYRPDEPPFGVHLLREGYDPDSSEEPISVGEGPTAPLAILVALVRALSNPKETIMANDAVPDDVRKLAEDAVREWLQDEPEPGNAFVTGVVDAIMADRATRPSREDVLEEAATRLFSMMHEAKDHAERIDRKAAPLMGSFADGVEEGLSKAGFAIRSLKSQSPFPAVTWAELDAIRTAFNKAINFALDKYADDPGRAVAFLWAWREGDTSEWPEFDAPSTPSVSASPVAPETVKEALAVVPRVATDEMAQAASDKLNVWGIGSSECKIIYATMIEQAEERSGRTDRVSATANITATSAAPASPSRPVEAESLRLVRNIKWVSDDKDNMEFVARASCYQVDALNTLLSTLTVSDQKQAPENE